jgi:hypothetical protein
MKHMSKSLTDQHGITVAIIKHREGTQVKSASKQNLKCIEVTNSWLTPKPTFTWQWLT